MRVCQPATRHEVERWWRGSWCVPRRADSTSSRRSRWRRVGLVIVLDMGVGVVVEATSAVLVIASGRGRAGKAIVVAHGLVGVAFSQDVAVVGLVLSSSEMETLSIILSSMVTWLTEIGGQLSCRMLRRSAWPDGGPWPAPLQSCCPAHPRQGEREREKERESARERERQRERETEERDTHARGKEAGRHSQPLSLAHVVTEKTSASAPASRRRL